jgi:hypothetical protein
LRDVRRTIVILLACVAATGISACGSSSSTATEAPAPTQAEAPAEDEATPETEHADSGGFTGQDASNYETAKTTCSAFPRSQIAKEYGLATDADPSAIARAVSHGYKPAFQQAVFEGCLVGL